MSSLETLQVQRVIPASPERIFRAWTDPEELQLWWGPQGVKCLSAEIDCRVGGAYKIANELPDGSVLWIKGTFEAIEKPHLLIYSWIVENQAPDSERVRVQFQAHDLGTNVIITHERIATESLRDQHRQGWFGCLDGLVTFFADP